LICVYLTPVIPDFTKRGAKLFGENVYIWSDLKTTVTEQKLELFESLFTRIDKKAIEAMTQDTIEQQAAHHHTPAPSPSSECEPLAPEIEIQDFSKIDLRVGKVLSCEDVPEAGKLLKMQIDLGPLGQRQIFSGIKKFFRPEEIIGRYVVVVANLKPRKMKFGMSEGMVTMASQGDEGLWFIAPELGAKPGMRIT
jgi:methionyl-tRNA synthetase